MWLSNRKYTAQMLPDPLCADSSYLIDVCGLLGIPVPAAAEPGRAGWALEESQRVAAALTSVSLPPPPETQPYLFFVGDLACFKPNLYADMLLCKLAVKEWNAAVAAMKKSAESGEYIDSVGLLVVLDHAVELLRAAPAVGTSVKVSTFAALCTTLHQRGDQLAVVAAAVRFYYQSGPLTREIMQASTLVNVSAILSKHALRMVDEWTQKAETALATPSVPTETYAHAVRMCSAWMAHVNKPHPSIQQSWLRTHTTAVAHHSIAPSAKTEVKDVQEAIKHLMADSA